MRVYEVKQDSTRLDGLRMAERPEPEPGPSEIKVRIRAASLNYRDHMVVMGTYFTTPDRDIIPASDGAGEVVAVGSGVKKFKIGDRVVGTFFQVWKDGPRLRHPPALGVPLDGVLAEYVVFQEDGAVHIPASLSFEEAASLPCAGVTAWNALMEAGRPIKPGDIVLCQGTGGVSMLALQFVKAAGARAIVTSSSSDKLKRAKDLGATDGINYRNHPDWDQEILRITNGHGVDHIIEIGGAGSIARSYRALAHNGKIGLIGFLAGFAGDANPSPLMMKGASLHGIGVGSTRMFEDMNRAIELNGIKPVIDTVFPFEDAREAYRRLADGNFVGKLVVNV